MDQRLDVPRVERKGPVELGQRALRLRQQRERHAEQVVHVSKRVAGGQDLLQHVDRAVIILQREPLAGAGQQQISWRVHGPP